MWDLRWDALRERCKVMPFDIWLLQVASELGAEPEDILSLYQVRELLYDAGASPKEAADFIRVNVG